MEHSGYYLLPRVHPHSPGYTGLLVAIREKPTGKHFDPESIHLDLWNPMRARETATLNLHTPLAQSRRVSPGLIQLVDRLNKEEFFHSFGGTIESAAAAGELVFSLRSTAPILQVTPDGESAEDQLAAEAGHHLAELKAQGASSEEAFYRLLARVDPLALYVGLIQASLADYERLAALRRSYPALHSLLHSEQHWLQETGRWPEHPGTLEQLFQAL